MSLRPLLQQAIQHSVDFDVPSERWLNGNNAVFGGWTMFKACEMAVHHANEFSVYADQAEDGESAEFTVQAFKFRAPAHVGVPIRFDMSSDAAGNIDVIAADFHNRVVLEARLSCSKAVGDYTPQDMMKVLELMSMLDMEGGRSTNLLHPHRDSQVCVTASIEGLQVYNVAQYQSGLPNGRFDLVGFKEERIENAQNKGIVDPRYFTAGERVSENLKAVSLQIGCEQADMRFAHVGAMVFVNVSREDGRPTPMDWRATQLSTGVASFPKAAGS